MDRECQEKADVIAGYGYHRNKGNFRENKRFSSVSSFPCVFLLRNPGMPRLLGVHGGQPLEKQLGTDEAKDS